MINNPRTDRYGYHIPMSNKTKAVRKAVKRAFKSLEDKGWFAKRDFWCCQSCAVSDIPEGTKNYIFYHNQDEEGFQIYGTVCLAFAGDTSQILDALAKEKLHISWNGSEHQRIEVVGICPTQYKDEKIKYNPDSGSYDTVGSTYL
tara:strand:+ start:69 stop:503 length:435 start_codon:yes stop_codon:yes gene_type:complete